MLFKNLLSMLRLSKDRQPFLEEVEKVRDDSSNEDNNIPYLDLLKLLSNIPRGNLDLNQTMSTILNWILKFTDMDSGAIYIKDDLGLDMQMFIQQGFSQEYQNSMKTITVGRGFSGRAAQVGKLRFSEIRCGDPRFIRTDSEQEGFRNFVSVPISSDYNAPNQLLGVLNMASKKKTRLMNEQLQLLQILGKQLGNTLTNYRFYSLGAKREILANGLYNIAVELQSHHDIQTICRIVCEETRILFGSDYCLVSISFDLKEPEISCTGFPCWEEGKRLAALLSQQLKNTDIIIHGKMLNNMFSQLDLNIHSLCVVPILITGTVSQGLIAIAYRNQTELNEEKAALERLSSQLSTALYNAKLYQNSQELAIVKERNWLAREMHDSLAQILGSARFELANAKQFLLKKNIIDATKHMNSIDSVLEKAYLEIREMILGLRTKLSTENNFIGMIQTYLQSYSDQCGIAVTQSLPKPMNIPAAMEVQLIRIIQEALSNVRKHAKTKEVFINMAVEENRIYLNIKDFGCGFSLDVQPKNSTQFGLSVMKERVQLIYGSLEIISVPGYGTEIKAYFPINERMYNE